MRVADAQIISVQEAKQAAARGEGAASATGNLHVGLWISRPQPARWRSGRFFRSRCFTGTSGCLMSGGAMGGPECGLSASSAVTQANDLTSVPQLLPVQNGDE